MEGIGILLPNGSLRYMQISNKVTKIIQLASVKDFMICYSVEGLPRVAEMERERAFVDEIKKKSVTT